MRDFGKIGKDIGDVPLGKLVYESSIYWNLSDLCFDLFVFFQEGETTSKHTVITRNIC